MSPTLTVLVAWCSASVVVGPIVGALLAAGGQTVVKAPVARPANVPG